MTSETPQPATDPEGVVERLLNGIVDGDPETVSHLAYFSESEIDSLRVRHSTNDQSDRLEPEFTVTDGNRVTVVVWLSVRGPDGELDIYSFDTFDVDGGRIVWHISNAVPELSYQHSRTLAARRRPEPDFGPADQTGTRPAALVAQFNRAVFEDRNASAVKQFVAENYRQHAEWRGPSGRAGLEDVVSHILSSPPPPNHVLPRPLFEAEQGDLAVMAASIGPIVAFDAYLVKDNLLTEHWSGVDPRRRP